MIIQLFKNYLVLRKIKSLKLQGKRILIISGAGISKEAGIETFREGGIYDKNPELKYLLRPDTFETDPQFLYNFHNDFKLKNKDKIPTLAHKTIAENGLQVITQNIDNLHELAGSKKVLHIHGDLETSRCEKCKEEFGHYFEFGDTCIKCQGRLRHNVILFKEALIKNDLALRMIKECDVLIQVGSSGIVYPVADYVKFFNSYHEFKKVSICVDVGEPKNRNSFNFFLKGSASQIIPNLVSALLK